MIDFFVQFGATEKTQVGQSTIFFNKGRCKLSWCCEKNRFPCGCGGALRPAHRSPRDFASLWPGECAPGGPGRCRDQPFRPGGAFPEAGRRHLHPGAAGGLPWIQALDGLGNGKSRRQGRAQGMLRDEFPENCVDGRYVKQMADPPTTSRQGAKDSIGQALNESPVGRAAACRRRVFGRSAPSQV